jgi:hypothetical protein
MKKFLFTTFAICLSILILYGCGESKPERVMIEKLEVYEDPGFGFSIKYPANWAKYEQPGMRFSAVTSKQGTKRFQKYDQDGVPAAMLQFSVNKLEDGKTLDSVMAKKFFQPSIYSAPKKITIDGTDAYMQSYNFPLADGEFQGEIYYATKDSQVVSVISFETFANGMDVYRNQFDEIISSIKLAEMPVKTVDTLVQEVEADPPSSTFRTMTGDGFSIEIPDNFSKEGGLYIGLRRGDSFIKVDSKEVTADTDFKKTVEETQKKFRNAKAVKEITLDGHKAYMFAYEPAATVDGEVYFSMKDNKLFQITINWFKEEAGNYKDIFQKSVKTIKLK